MAQNLFRFTLSHASGSKVISEPEGWAKIKLTLERDKEYHSLIELIETPFIFYGSNGVHDGGRDYLKNINDVYGVDAQVNITIDISVDEGSTWEDLFLGIIDMQSIRDIDSRKIEVVIMRDDLWAKFKSRVDTPVIINQSDNLDGGSSSTGQILSVNMISQRVIYKSKGYLEETASFPANELPLNTYLQISHEAIELDEINDWYTQVPTATNTVIPVSKFRIEYEGDYTFIDRYELSVFSLTRVSFIDTYAITELNTGIGGVEFYFKINDSAPIAYNRTDIVGGAIPSGFISFNSTVYEYNDTHTLIVGDEVTIYAQVNEAFFEGSLGPNYVNTSLIIWAKDAVTGSVTVLRPIVSGYSSDTINFGGVPSTNVNPANIDVSGNTIYLNTQAEGFYLYDAADKILDRILDNPLPLYSDYLGSPETLGSYAEAGCGWPFVLVRGLQIRQYSLADKPFSISFNQWWKGINPIHNLGLTYENNGLPFIRIEEKAFFYNDSPIIYLNWVNNIEQSYDKEYIFNKIKTGFSKWQSEDISGIDDPQTKHTYATLFKYVGQELILESDFIAASLAIETTRRTTKEKSKDYKFDNETFIIAIDPAVPGGQINPSTDDYFDSVTNLLNADTRYNISLTPGRNLLRWLNFIAGCLQKDLTSSIKFTGGEGNYDMESNWNSFVYGNCFNITDDNFSEKQAIDLATYEPLTGHLFQPIVLEFKHPISFSDYKQIRENRTRAIAVSGTDGNHAICFIKKLEYDLINSIGTFTVWKK